MGVRLEGAQQEAVGLRGLAVVAQLAGERQPRAPVAGVLRHEPLAEGAEARGLAGRRIGPPQEVEGEVGTLGDGRDRGLEHRGRAPGIALEPQLARSAGGRGRCADRATAPSGRPPPPRRVARRAAPPGRSRSAGSRAPARRGSGAGARGGSAPRRPRARGAAPRRASAVLRGRGGSSGRPRAPARRPGRRGPGSPPCGSPCRGSPGCAPARRASGPLRASSARCISIARSTLPTSR